MYIHIYTHTHVNLGWPVGLAIKHMLAKNISSLEQILWFCAREVIWKFLITFGKTKQVLIKSLFLFVLYSIVKTKYKTAWWIWTESRKSPHEIKMLQFKKYSTDTYWSALISTKLYILSEITENFLTAVDISWWYISFLLSHKWQHHSLNSVSPSL